MKKKRKVKSKSRRTDNSAKISLYILRARVNALGNRLELLEERLRDPVKPSAQPVWLTYTSNGWSVKGDSK